MDHDFWSNEPFIGSHQPKMFSSNQMLSIETNVFVICNFQLFLALQQVLSGDCELQRQNVLVTRTIRFKKVQILLLQSKPGSNKNFRGPQFEPQALNQAKLRWSKEERYCHSCLSHVSSERACRRSL